MLFIDLKRQYEEYKQEIDNAIANVLYDASFVLGPQVSLLEKLLADFVGVKHCITVASGTDALRIGLMSLNIGPGNEVITTPLSWISTVEAICEVGAIPVFVDINPDVYLIDETLIEKKITNKTKAILPVSLYGQMPNFKKINSIADKYSLSVIEDGAQAFGALQQGKRSCSLTTVGTTSFFPSKPLGCYGDGGALFTNSDMIADRARMIRMHGRRDSFESYCIGLNSRLDTIQAAIILVKLAHFEEELQMRENIANYYSDNLDTCGVPRVLSGNTHTFAVYTIKVNNRNKIMEALLKLEIPTKVYYEKCLHQLKAYYQKESFVNAEDIVTQILSLPMHPYLARQDQDLIIEAINKTT